MLEPLVKPVPQEPFQKLPREAYVSQEWFEREKRELFARTWTFAATTMELAAPGDYVTMTVGDYPLMVMRDRAGDIRAYHNICRHRGTQMLDGSGTIGSTIVCPYHKWSYNLDGTLKGVPNRTECFPGLDRSQFGLLPVAVGVFRELVFVSPDPLESFEDWLADLPSVAWPHDLASLHRGEELILEMNCNWKIYFENSIDGYHLAYLHDKTLGGPLPSRNIWDAHGRHLVWYALDEEGRKLPGTASAAKAAGVVPTAGEDDYGGVYMLFPTTIFGVAPGALTMAEIVALSPEKTLLRTRVWSTQKTQIDPGQAAAAEAFAEGIDPESGHFRLDRLKRHALESNSFTIEDIWICEKAQRGHRSPVHTVGALAAGAGGEEPVQFFQEQILDFMPPSRVKGVKRSVST